MTPEWALANLYHGGIRATEVWYVRSTTPISPRYFDTGTIYGPYLVVGLIEDDAYIGHFRYRKLETFNPVEISKRFLERMKHYISK